MFMLLDATQMRARLNRVGSSEAIHGAMEFCQKVNRYNDFQRSV